MAWPASTLNKMDAFRRINAIALKLKSVALDLRNQSAAGPTGRTSYTALYDQLDKGINEWVTLQSMPGLAAFIQDQLDDNVIDVVAEYTAMRNAAITLRDWIGANLPTDVGSGAVLERLPDGTELTFTSVQTTDFRTNVDTFVATIG